MKSISMLLLCFAFFAIFANGSPDITPKKGTAALLRRSYHAKRQSSASQPIDLNSAVQQNIAQANYVLSRCGNIYLACPDNGPEE
jgi:hypothetical protein